MELSEEAIDKLNSLSESVEPEKETPTEISEEVEEDAPEQEEQESNQDEGDPELSDLEREASKKGWKPNGEKSAQEFLRAEPLYEELKNRGKEIKELKKSLEDITQMMQSQKELTDKNYRRDLKAQRDESIRMGDVEAVNELDAKLNKGVDNTPPAAKDFIIRHSDWIKDPSYQAEKMREFVTQRDLQLIEFKLSPEDHIATLEKDIKDKFPDYFNSGKEESKGTPVQPVMSDSSPYKPSKKAPKYTVEDLSPEQKKCMYRFEKQGAMSKEEYIEHLAKSGDLKKQ